MRFLFLLLLGLTVAGLTAQDDLRADADYFLAQADHYQRWLDHTGLGQFLRVQTTVVEADEVNLFLNLGTSSADEAASRWAALKERYERDAPLDLERALFYKARTLFQLRPEQLSVEVYDNYVTEATFMRMMVYEDDRFRVDASDLKSVVRKLEMTPRKVDGQPLATAEFRERFSRERVFACVRAFAAERYAAMPCALRTPSVQEIGEGDGDVLQFEVTDLCREVLTEEGNPLICAWLDRLGRPCNWTKREMLIYTVNYEETLEGFRLTLDIDGRVGSGFFDEVGRRGYLSMDIDFEDELSTYADRIKRAFRAYLNDCDGE